jgi:hypothetical protein
LSDDDGTTPVDQSAGVAHEPETGAAQLSVQVGPTAPLGVADTRATAPAEPSEATVTATVTATRRNPTIIVPPLFHIGVMPAPHVGFGHDRRGPI